jgi:hypothetical protein
MSFGSAIALVQQFASRKSAEAFPNLGLSRSLFAQALMDRINSPTMIDQGATSLCGPAVFLYNVLKREPEDFAKYVIGLYETGSGRIGSLQIKPGADCRNYRPLGAQVAAVDWVALASLRDGANAVLDYDSASVQVGGITLPGTLAGWFSAANFGQVENKTNLFFDSDLSTLVKASQRFSSGSVVCLLIGANLLTGRAGDTTIPDHWVSLSSPIRVDGVATTHLASQGDKINGDEKLAKAGIGFDVFTWGETSYPVTKRRAGLNVETCIDYFYGYVAAK